MTEVIRVCITGAAGQIAYSLLPLFANGSVFGKDKKVALNLLDIEPAMKMLNGVVMELEDGGYPLLTEVIATSDATVAFSGVDLAVLVGAMPRRQGMERSDLLKANCGIFKAQGAALAEKAGKGARVLVVGNPANTNCFIALQAANKDGEKIPKENFSALTRLDHQRAIGQIAKRFSCSVDDVSGAYIWGNHSGTQYPDVSHCLVKGKPIAEAAKEQGEDTVKWLNEEFESLIQKRGASVIAARGLSSAMSAANAIASHARDWYIGTDAPVSMAVASDGSYGVPEGLIYSFPVKLNGGWKYEIVRDLDVSDHSRKMMDATADELISERDTAVSFLNE